VIFGEVPVADSEGLMLAHTVKLPGLVLRKGRVLSSSDLAALIAAGVSRVSGARLAPGELDEDQAADTLAELVAGEGLTRKPAATGRCNLYATEPGLLLVDRNCVDALNAVDESATLGTLPPFAPVTADQRVATIKIIPFAVAAPVIARWRELAERPPLRLAPWRPRRAALILSESAATTPKLLAGTVTATRARLERLGSRLELELRCPHERSAIGQALAQALSSDCDLVLISGATVSKDRGDLVPAALVAAGGEIVHFGMPVEPGNMLLLGRIWRGTDWVPVVNLPGCARSRRTNGLDWVLERLHADLPLYSADMMAMGAGGLLHSADDLDREDELPQSPQTDGRSKSRIAALVLAAGASSRMGGPNKLLTPLGGRPLVCRTVEAALGSRCDQTLVVTGRDALAVESVLEAERVSLVRNPDFATGLASSLRAGLAALPADTQAVLVLLGDMPMVSSAHVDRLIQAFDPERPSILVPTYGGRRGNPVLWPRRYFGELRGLSGDTGGRALLAAYASETVAVPIEDSGILTDIDTPDDLAGISL
jgi:molybdenum cofactor cytidylyltransferase